MDPRALSENKLALIAYVHRLSNLFDYFIFKGPRKDLTPLKTERARRDHARRRRSRSEDLEAPDSTQSWWRYRSLQGMTKKPLKKLGRYTIGCALYTFCRLRLLQEKQKAEAEQMKLKERRQFLRKKLQELDLKIPSSLFDWPRDAS